MNKNKTNKELKLAKTAEALAAWEPLGLLCDTDMKKHVHDIIRKGAETPTYHWSVDYRSINIATLRALLGLPKSAYHRHCSKNASHEHMTPVAVIYKMIMKLKIRSAKNILALLVKYCIRATITKEENDILNAAGYKSTMPEEFYTLTEGYENLYENPRARYIAAGIDDKLVVNTLSV